MDRFINPIKIKNIFQRYLYGFSQGTLLITHCSIQQIRLRRSWQNPSFTLSVHYTLVVTDISRGKCGKQMLFCKVYPSGQSDRAFHSAKRSGLAKPRFGEPLAHIPEFNMVVWAFPNDPKIPYLPEVIDPKKVKPHLPISAFGEGITESDRLTHRSLKVVRYFPQDRCTTRHHLEWGPSTTPSQIVIYGKTFKDTRGAEIYNRIEQVWEQRKLNQEAFMIAQPLGYHEGIRTIWQLALPGLPLTRYLNRFNFQYVLKWVAKGLAAFHKSDIHCSRIEINHRLAAIQQRIDEMCDMLPSFKKSLSTLYSKVAQNSSVGHPVPDKPVHGAFRMKQLVIHEKKLGMLDLDGLAVGDPLQDLACFLVDFYIYQFDPKLVHTMTKIFLHTYKHDVPWEVPDDQLHWHQQIHFINRAYSVYRRKRLDLGFEGEFKRILHLASHECIDGNLS